MTKREALFLLQDVWGSGGNISTAQLNRVNAAALPDENTLATVCRIAEVRYQTIVEAAYDADTVWHLASRLLVADDLERARRYR